MAYPRIGRRVVRFPFGYRVEIREVNQCEITRRGVPDACGLWVPNDKGGTIFVARQQDYDSKLDTLQHELAHSVTDYDSWLQMHFAEPFRHERLLQVAQDVEEAD